MSLNKNNKIQNIKYAPPPTELSVLGKGEQRDIVFIGRTNYVAALEEKKYIFGIKRSDIRHHLYILGKSGVGKSKLQELMIRQDIAYGHGVCLIDSDGGLIDNILDFIPENRINDVCLIDIEDVEFPFAFNIFSNVDDGFKYQLNQGLINIFEKQFGLNWNPRLEHILRMTIFALLDYPLATIGGIIKILDNKEYRDDVISYIKDDMVKKFWLEEFEDWSLKFESDAVIPIKNRFSQFLSNPILSNIFNQNENKINIDEIIKTQKILLVNLSHNKIGEENASLLGAIILIKLKQAGVYRSDVDFKNKQDFYVYIDDIHSIATETFGDMLSESKKYGINLIFSNRNNSQIPFKIEQDILSNVGTIIVFRVSGEDATKLKPEFSSVFDIKDMVNLGVGEFYIKTIIEGESYDPFSAESLRVLTPDHRSFKNEIFKNSRIKYSAD